MKLYKIILAVSCLIFTTIKPVETPQLLTKPDERFLILGLATAAGALIVGALTKEPALVGLWAGESVGCILSAFIKPGKELGSAPNICKGALIVGGCLLGGYIGHSMK